MYYKPGLVITYDPSLDEWEALGYKSKEDFVAFLVHRRTNPTIPTIDDFDEIEEVRVYTAAGPAEQTWRVYRSGKPRYWFVLGHEMDSRWVYPEVRRTLLSGPFKVMSHAEMVRLQRIEKRRAIAIANNKLRTA